MKKIFWINPYQRTLKTVVSSIVGRELLFKETIAYSFSGGQESDRATVNGLPIVESRMEGNNIFYLLPEEHGLSENQEVIMEIDWERRNRLMRLHFACELILVIVNRLFGNKKPEEELEPEEIDNIGIVKTGAHMSEEKARVDFRLEENISTRFPAILSEYNRIITADLPIVTGFTDEETQRRFWRIPGFATVPCGGTHVRSTAEVGFVDLKRERGGKSVERIKITLKDSSPSSVAYEDDPVRAKSLLS
jgi:Ser-tRNA(Ala) deacylase AlaX